MATQTGQRYELPYKIRFYREDNATIIELPTGRRLTYTGARIAGKADHPQLVMPNPASPEKDIRFWGGYLVENIVQAVSRDILAEMILNIEKLGPRIPLTVHDDVSVIVPIDEVDTYRPQLEAIAKTPPVWAKELPIDIDCKVSHEYTK
jgi:DNA polymerase